MNSHLIRNLKLLAIHAVVEDTSDYALRKIMRWYSREFCTPLDAVESLPLEDILQHWFESQYEDREEADLQAEIDRLLISEDKLTEMKREEDAEDADQWEFGREAVEAEASKKAEPAKEVRDERSAALPEAALAPPLPVLEPDIHMTFEDVETDAFPDAPAFGPPPK